MTPYKYKQLSAFKKLQYDLKRRHCKYPIVIHASNIADMWDNLGIIVQRLTKAMTRVELSKFVKSLNNFNKKST
jgi:hypothetical protein